MVAIVEYKTSKTAYVIHSILNLALVSAEDIKDTKRACESKGGYFNIISYKKL